jgi:carbamoyl-phosphate synthase large subunit
MNQNEIHILMTGGGAPGAAGVLQCLQREPSFRITAADANANAVGRFLTKDFEVVPLAGDPAYIDFMISLCRRKKIDIVLPLVTRELVPLAMHAKRFEDAGTRVLVSTFASLEIANNKSRLYEFLQWRGIPVPEFRVVETVEQFRLAMAELNYPDRQVCFKPSESNGSRGFRIISEKMDALDLLFNHKPDATYIHLDEAIRILRSGAFPQLLVSEFLPGEEYSVDCLARNGESVLIIPRCRKRMINGISVEGEFVREPDIISYCEQIIRELQLHGNIGIQVKRSAAGEFLLLEINPRVQGTISAALGAGINLPVLAIKQELGVPVMPQELKVKWGTRFSRYWNEVFY